MTAILMGAATVILVALILWRGRSPEFRRKSELPKFQFLANLGLRSSAKPDEKSPDAPSTQKGHHESDQP